MLCLPLLQMIQILSKLALPLATWRANFLFNVAVAWCQLGEPAQTFDTHLRDRLVDFYLNQYACYPGMTGEELVRRVMESGLFWHLFFLPTLSTPLPAVGYHQYIQSSFPTIPLSSLRQFLQKLVLNMLCFKHARPSTRSKLYSYTAQNYLYDLIERWNRSEEFAIPYYHVCLDTMTAGQSVLMMSPPPADQLTILWTSVPKEIYNHLGCQFDNSIGEYVHESVHDPKWIDYKTFLLKWDPSNLLLHPSLKHLDWIPASKLYALRPPTVEDNESWD